MDLHVPAFTLAIPDLVRDSCVRMNGQRTACDVGLELFEIAWRDGAAVACLEQYLMALFLR